MKKIVFIITGLSTGGAEGMLLKLLANLDRTKFDPSVISLTSIGEFGPKIEATGIPVFAIGMSTTRPDLVSFFRLIKRIRAIRPDIVQTWMYHADLIGGLAARLCGVRAVAWSVRNSNLSPKLVKKSTLVVVKLCAMMSRFLPRKIVFCSSRSRDIHINVGYRAQISELIPNGFDLARFTPDNEAHNRLADELRLSRNSALIGLVARFDPQKNHLGFIGAAKLIHEVLPSSHFVFVGSGLDQQNQVIVDAISSAGIRDFVHLLGRRDDIPSLIASFDVLASPSHGEAFPNVLGEAMACGVPCVVTDVGDSAQIVGDTGIVVKADDMTAMAAGIVEILMMDALAKKELGFQTRMRIDNLYEISNVARQYSEFFEKLLEQDKKCAV